MRSYRKAIWAVAGVLGATLAAAASAPLNSGIDPSNFDTTVRAQDDFYHYVDGGWVARTEIPADRARWGSFDVLIEKAGNEVRSILEDPATGGPGADSDARKVKLYYDTFMDEAAVESLGLKPVAPELARVAAIKTKGDVAAEFARLDLIGAASPIEFAVHLDNKDSTRYIFDLFQGGIGMPDRDYYLKDDAKLVEVRGKYKAYITQLMTLAGDPDPAGKADAVLALETRIAQIQWTRTENRDPVKTYNRMDVAKLPGLTAQIDWQRYLAAVGVAGKITDLTVSQLSYFEKLGKLVADTPVAQWQAYFKWQVLNQAAPYLSRAVVDARFAFYGTALSDVPTNAPRWKRAVRATEAAMGEAVGREYVKRNFPPEAKARVEALVNNVLAAFRQSIDTLEWMGPDTKREAQAKLAAFNTKIGYPKRWRDYSKLEVRAGDLYGNVLRADAFEHQRGINKLGKPVDRDEWQLTPQAVTAYYSPEYNEIVFPAAILQPPFFQADADDAVNYGAIGAVIGHEISHGFDDQGSQFDGKGNLRDWWTKQDHERFAALTQALVAQYSAYEPVKGYNVNGQLTLGENIGDNSGLAVAYKAYRISLAGKSAPVMDGFTGDQRFYMGYAQIWRSKIRDSESIRRVKIDPHSPDAFRIRGTLANQDPFFAAFDIKEGDGMYTPPASRVHIW